jgi:NADPH-dependent 2,4-dienoyl-CoA reductase/sulfur reductase-like enzyme
MWHCHRQVMHVVENMETRETLEPLDLPEEEEKDGGGEAGQGGAKARPPRRVIVVGAGAAGLAAASTLKVGYTGMNG